MKPALPVVALACAALCACEPRPVADVVSNGLIDVAPFPAKGAFQVEVRNGTPVKLNSAVITCAAGVQSWSATLSRPLEGGSRIKLNTTPATQPAATEGLTCGFISAALDKAGRFVAPDGEPQAVVPSPEFGR